MPTTSEGVAAELRAEVARQSRTITDVANEAGIVPTTLQRKMRGLYPFDLDELISVCRVLRLTPSEIVARTEEPAVQP